MYAAALPALGRARAAGAAAPALEAEARHKRLDVSAWQAIAVGGGLGQWLSGMSRKARGLHALATELRAILALQSGVHSLRAGRRLGAVCGHMAAGLAATPCPIGAEPATCEAVSSELEPVRARPEEGAYRLLVEAAPFDAEDEALGRDALLELRRVDPERWPVLYAARPRLPPPGRVTWAPGADDPVIRGEAALAAGCDAEALQTARAMLREDREHASAASWRASTR